MTTTTTSSTFTKTITFLPPSSASSSAISNLPAHSHLQLWVQRPQSIVKCSISDVYAMPSLIPADVDPTAYFARDVYMHGTWPCRMVEIVAWVAGVDHKESTVVVTLDDGNGASVLPVTIRLRRRANAPKQAPKPFEPVQPAEDTTTRYFLPAKERKARRKQAAEVAKKEAEQARLAKIMAATYEQVDLRVGDIVRMVGRIEQWSRKRPDGSLEPVRQVVVEEGSGGSMFVVDPHEQFSHLHESQDLYTSTYSQPFEIPPISLQPSLPPSPIKSQPLSESMEPSSELGSVIDGEIDFKLRDPSKLRPSQLTDSTFRQYLLDYMTQEVLAAVSSSPYLEEDLELIFPEYRAMRRRLDKGKQRADVFGSSTRDNVMPCSMGEPDAGRCGGAFRLTPLTLFSILQVPHLAQLAILVVETEKRREEKRRRRRIRDGQARPRDIEVERERQRQGRDPKDWKLTDEERESKMLRLVGWVIRSAAEDGQVVQVALYSTDMEDDEGLIPRRKRPRDNEQYGYLALPPDVVLPIVCEIIRIEQDIRSKTFMRKTDPRRGHGMLLENIVHELQHCGVEGRWERVREWVVQDAIRLGVARGELRLEGRGWWLTDHL